MRMSCNGCRVLRKGCSENCSIRPCLDWIKSSDAQAHATVFLAKFYGRAGLMNLINTGPSHLRPAIFRSLLYEACGRMVNPIYGSVGLLGSGKWQLCQDAVEAVLEGSPVARIEISETGQGPPLKAYYDIRHISKGERESTITGSNHGPKRVRTRRRFKLNSRRVVDKESLSGRESSLISHHSEPRNESLSSVANHDDPNKGLLTRPEDDGPIELDLTLGFDSAKRWLKPRAFKVEEECNGSCKMELGLESLVSC